MVEVTEIIDDEQQEQEQTQQELSPSQERLLDADEIESLCNDVAKRPSVKAHLESLVKKIRRDASALKRMEDSAARLKAGQDDKNEKVNVETKEEEEVEEVIVEEVETAAATTAKPASASVPPPQAPQQLSTLQKYKNIDKFLFDAGSYNSPTVSIYITSLPSQIYSLPKENITCNFTKTSFDLKILDPQNPSTNSYRLVKDNLDKDINPDKCKLIIKKNKIIIKLGKVKSEYGSYESWMDLTSKKSKESKAKSKADPSASIMDMMKEMYDSGDDNMKKMIGETMLKQREGKLGGEKPGMGMGMDDIWTF